MKKRKLLILILFSFYFSDLFSQVSVEGFAVVCPGEQEVYGTNTPYSPNTSSCTYEWEVKNGRFSNGQTTISGKSTEVTVTWDDVIAIDGAVAPTGFLKVRVSGCQLGEGESPTAYKDKILIKTLNNVMPKAFPESTLKVVVRGHASPISYAIPRVFIPNTGIIEGTSAEYAKSYEWVLPAGWKVGNNTSDGITPIIVNHQNGYQISVIPDKCTGGPVKVRAYSGCPNSSLSEWRSITVNRSMPTLSFSSAPNYVVCGNKQSITVSVKSVPGATTYSWNKPSGWSGSSNSNSITLTPNGTNGGTISVKANICGQQTAALSKVVSLEAFDPNRPLSISGPSLVCTSNSTFTVNNAPSTAKITWTKSSNITREYVPGEPSSSYTVKATRSTTSGSGWVQAVITNCGETITLPRRNFWVGPPIISATTPSSLGVTEMCFSTIQDFRVTRTSGGSGLLTYEWSVVNNVSGLDLTPNGAICRVFARNTGNYTLRVRVRSACGWGSVRDFPIKVVVGSSSTKCGGMAQRFGDYSNDDEGELVQLEEDFSIAPEFDLNTNSIEIGNGILIYPNPSKGEVTLDISEDVEILKGKGYHLMITDNSGKVIYNSHTLQRKFRLNLQHVSKGIYHLVLYYKDGEFREKIIIE